MQMHSFAYNLDRNKSKRKISIADQILDIKHAKLCEH